VIPLAQNPAQKPVVVLVERLDSALDALVAHGTASEL